VVGRRVAALAVLLVVVATACSEDDDPTAHPPEPFCQAAIALEEFGPVRGRVPELDDQIELVREVAETAPADIQPQAETFLDALERYRDGDDSVIDDAEIQEAVNDVNRYATNGCELFERDNPNGGGSPF
jgi:hypothetical protein